MKLTMNMAAAFGLAATTFMAGTAQAKELALAHFMGPNHPMSAAVFEPFADRLEEISNGELTVRIYPGGALNSVPPRQYSILLDGVTDIAFALPGYTGDLFPATNVVSMPGVCESATECTEALLRARDEIAKEYNAKLLAVWANEPPVLLTRDKPVRTLEDLQGMKVRVSSKQDVPFVEALGASPVAQPVTEINQNLTNGVIDGITIDAGSIESFKLAEPANYVTTWFPGSGAAFVLLMNNGIYEGLSAEEKAWIDAASDESLSLSGGQAYQRSAERGLEAAREDGIEIIELSDEEKQRFEDAIAPVLDSVGGESAGDRTVAEIMAIMKGAQ